MLSLGLGRHNKLLYRFAKWAEAIGVSEQDRRRNTLHWKSDALRL
jgi:hypothetical protein